MPSNDDEGVVDIEDIIGVDGANDIERISHNQLIIRPKLVSLDEHTELEPVVKSNLSSFLPGTHKIFVKTWGCSHNNSDGEYMAGLLASSGYPIVSNEDEAQLIVLNSCTVKNPAEDHFRNAINSAHSKGKLVVVAGCVSQATPNADYLKNLSIVGVQQIDRVVEVVEETLKGNKVRLLGKKKVNRRKAGGASLNLPKIRRNPLIEIIPISTGCLNQCTYCKTKHARGDLGSYPIDEIVARAVEAFKDGCKEIWLTSEDTGAYGKDIGTSLPKLLYEIVQIIPNGCFLRLGMTNPPYIKEHLHDMVSILSHPRVYSFLHVPVQSGSDQVLADMKREYCCLDFEEIVDYLRERVPGITIATDIICGFPTETEEDFEETIKLVDKYRFPSLFINQYYPRPGTVAAKMKRIPANKVRERTKRLTELFESHLPYEGREGREYSVLVTEESRDKRFWVGHNKCYEQILIPKATYLMGRTLRVRIISTARYYMFGQPINYFDRLSSSLSSIPLTKVKKSLAIATGIAILTSGLFIYIRPKLRF